MRIERIDIVGGFQADSSAPLRLGPLLSSIADGNETQVSPLAVAGVAPPNIPRFMVGLGQNVLQVALDRVQLTISPPDHIRASVQEVVSYTQAEISRNLSPLLSESWMKSPWAGVVFSIAIPIEGSTATEAAAKAASAITNLKWPSDGLKTFQLQIGREKDGYFHTFTIVGYEQRTAKIEMPVEKGMNVINLDDTNSILQEGGLGITIDINNKPQSPRADHRQGIDDVVKRAVEAIDTLIPDLHLGGVVS